MKQLTKDTYKVYWQHTKPYRGIVVLMVLSLALVTALDVVTPLFYKKFFDVIAAGSSNPAATFPKLFAIVLQVLALNALSWGLWRISVFSNNFLQPRVMTNLINTAFEYLHEHSYGFFVNRFAGALVRKVNRFSGAFENIADKLYWDLFPLVIKISGILIVLFIKSALLGWLMLGWAVLFMAINYSLAIYKLKYDIRSAEIDTRVTARLADTITNNVTIKLFTGFRDEVASFRRLTDEEYKMSRFVWNLGGYIEAVQAALTVILEFLIFWAALHLWREGRLTIGDFVLLQAYVLTTIHQLWNFGRIFRQLYKNLADAEEMTEILNTPHEIQNEPAAPHLVVQAGKIEFRDVSFTYKNGRSVMKNFNLIIQPGERVGIVGASGAGKTTLSALLFRFYDVRSGQILFDGQNIADVTQESLRSNISLVPQEPILFHRSLMENMRYGRRDATDQAVISAARLAHCDEFIEALPEKYNTYVGERGIKLSGGERQRVAIARAILKNAPILVLDEATSSLDSHSESLIQDALANLMKGKTTIVIAHRLSTIMRLDRIVVMKDGARLEEGTHQMLLDTSDSLYKKLWELQVGGFIV
ncbi:MAG: ABC transporter ATP-binding protein [Candidatus Sungbacteria bacterium]|uniref:ABC transporter ATP-binding protein n=1 Tax=Candidatus Sungiibacteriota bacterium TaxID=2750080 RepID=A0A9D6LSW2_9BACT|nr:ABC transporter ATP-binding protein [Candidatus Sungbacteria bacterium]